MRRKSTLVWGGLALVVIALIAINVALREDPEPEFTPMPESRAPMVEVRLEETDAGQAPAAVAHFIEPIANDEPAAGGEGEAETETAEAPEAPETAGCDNPFVPSAPGEWRRYTWQQSGLDQVAELRVEAVAARELPTGQREIAWSVEITSAEDGSPLAREQLTTRCTFGRGAEEPWFGILERSRGLTPIDSPERWRWPSHLSAHQTFEGTAQFDPTGADMRIPTGVRGPRDPARDPPAYGGGARAGGGPGRPLPCVAGGLRGAARLRSARRAGLGNGLGRARRGHGEESLREPGGRRTDHRARRARASPHALRADRVGVVARFGCVALAARSCDLFPVSEGKALWEAIGELRRTRRELVQQLATAVRDTSVDVTCSFCGDAPPAVVVIPGPDAAICDRCVGLCREILDASRDSP